MNYTFDVDINVSIEDPIEQYNKVGWHCGNKKTKYLSWITGDNTHGRTRNSISRC